MSQIEQFREVCEQAARAGGAVLLDWVNRFSVRHKAPADLVTEADLAAQEKIKAVLLGAFPGHGLLGEEGASIPSRDSGYRWVVDPLDGTTNYVHGIPFYCVSVALEQHGDLVVGAVFEPVGEECFTAAAGRGATLNGQPIHTSGATDLSQAMVACSFPPAVDRDHATVAEFVEVLARSRSTRRIGSSALNLSYLAAGRIDGYWSSSTHTWDIAAGWLLVREAGGIVARRDGSPPDLEHPNYVAAATPQLHAQLCQTLAQAVLPTRGDRIV